MSFVTYSDMFQFSALLIAFATFILYALSLINKKKK